MIEPRIERLRRLIEEQYQAHPTGCGGSFGELLCYELHSGGLTFVRLADKWRMSLPTLGMLIADHCNRMEEDPEVNLDYPVPWARSPSYGDRPPKPIPPQNEFSREDDPGRG